MDTLVLLGTVFGVGFVSGINLYATVLALGLSVRLGILEPLAAYGDLDVLAHPAVLWTAAVMYVVEFIADKIPWIDSAWDAVHTVVRPVGAAVLAAVAIGDLDPVFEAVLVLASGGIALTSHTTKASTRMAANASPEPFSNWVLSLFEDAIAVVGALASFFLPLLVLSGVVVFLIAFVWFAPKVFRVLSAGLKRLRPRAQAVE